MFGGCGGPFGHYWFLEFGVEFDVCAMEVAHDAFAVALKNLILA